MGGRQVSLRAAKLATKQMCVIKLGVADWDSNLATLSQARRGGLVALWWPLGPAAALCLCCVVGFVFFAAHVMLHCVSHRASTTAKCAQEVPVLLTASPDEASASLRVFRSRTPLWRLQPPSDHVSDGHGPSLLVLAPLLHRKNQTSTSSRLLLSSDRG